MIPTNNALQATADSQLVTNLAGLAIGALVAVLDADSCRAGGQQAFQFISGGIVTRRSNSPECTCQHQVHDHLAGSAKLTGTFHALIVFQELARSAAAGRQMTSAEGVRRCRGASHDSNYAEATAHQRTYCFYVCPACCSPLQALLGVLCIAGAAHEGRKIGRALHASHASRLSRRSAVVDLQGATRWAGP